MVVLWICCLLLLLSQPQLGSPSLLPLPTASRPKTQWKRKHQDGPSIPIHHPNQSSYLTPRRNRDLALLYHGAQERIRAAMDLMMTGRSAGPMHPPHLIPHHHALLPPPTSIHPAPCTLLHESCTLHPEPAVPEPLPSRCVAPGHQLNITFLGGSVTEGIGLVPNSASWPDWLVKMMHATFTGAKIRLVNGARGATMSDYMSLCLQVSTGPCLPGTPRHAGTTHGHARHHMPGTTCLAPHAGTTCPVPHAWHHMHGTT